MEAIYKGLFLICIKDFELFFISIINIITTKMCAYFMIIKALFLKLKYSFGGKKPIFRMKCEKIQTSIISKFFVKRIVPEAILPKKGTTGSAGYDICAI